MFLALNASDTALRQPRYSVLGGCCLHHWQTPRFGELCFRTAFQQRTSPISSRIKSMVVTTACQTKCSILHSSIHPVFLSPQSEPLFPLPSSPPHPVYIANQPGRVGSSPRRRMPKPPSPCLGLRGWLLREGGPRFAREGFFFQGTTMRPNARQTCAGAKPYPASLPILCKPQKRHPNMGLIRVYPRAPFHACMYSEYESQVAYPVYPCPYSHSNFLYVSLSGKRLFRTSQALPERLLRRALAITLGE